MTKSLNLSKDIFSPQVQKQIKDILSQVASFKDEVDAILLKYKPSLFQIEATQILEHLFLRFHSVVKQLQKRQRERKPFIVNDEYDVQDLLYSLLQIYFDDVRPEEYCPSYAGTSARIDFFLKEEQVAIEAKMTSKDHGRKMIAKELILDKEYYRKKEGVRILYCLVYDPYEIITNPQGFENDISEKRENFEAKVFVVPRKV
jgi:hypothetical protein